MKLKDLLEVLHEDPLFRVRIGDKKSYTYGQETKTLSYFEIEKHLDDEVESITSSNHGLVIYLNKEKSPRGRLPCKF